MLKLAYYADDFTGATDALESLARAGLRTRLFLSPPDSAQCAGLEAVGVAGCTRALAPAAMAAELQPAFTALRALAPRHVHYKVCSTFDSSPTVGSIGRAIDTGAAIFGGRTVPLLVAAPALGRYCAFGQLFARYGIGSSGAIYRLDQHPAISRHPVTPMTEPDLRRHLAKQTDQPSALLDVPTLDGPTEAIAPAYAALVQAGAKIVLIDGLNDTHLRKVGALLEGLANDGPLFSVGSSGIESALTVHWAPPAPAAWPRPDSAGPLLVVSGSCSPVTAGQIDRALAGGFAGLPFNPLAPADPAVGAAALAALQAGRSVLIYSSRGTAGPAVPAADLGTALGRLAGDLVAKSGVRRLIIAGGDTSSYAARALGLAALDFLAPLAPGAPWCRAHAPGSPVDGLAVNFKGGQVGAEDYFTAAAQPSL